MRMKQVTEKRISKYPYHRELTETELVGKSINRLRFKSNIYQTYAPVTRIVQMVKDVQKLSGITVMSSELIKDGLQYCHIFSDNYKYALKEFRALCFGDW